MRPRGHTAPLALPLALLAACTDLEPPPSALNCVRCLPACAADVDVDDLEGSARRIGCDPALVIDVSPTPGFVVTSQPARIGVRFASELSEEVDGEGCDGPIRMVTLGAVNAIPHAIAADIVTHASLHSLPLWPRSGACVPGSYAARAAELDFVPREPLQPFLWYEVRVDRALALEGGALCSELSWRFTVSPCGDGVIDAAESFTDWVCLGHVEAERGWFDPYQEQCDDGNRTIQDGCSPSCVKEIGWTCDDHGCRTRCGDGVRAGTEQCDFGKVQPEGCDAECQVAPGYRCDSVGCMPLED